MIGHNSLGPDDDLPEGLPRLEIAKIEIRGILEDLDRLPLDLRGAYVTFLFKMYQHMEAFPNDDRAGAIAFGRVDIRTYRRVKDELVKLGLLYRRPSGRLSTFRFDDAIKEYVVQYRNRQTAALDRESRLKDQKRAQFAKIERELPKNFPKTSTELRPNFGAILKIENVEVSQKPNEINVTPATVGQCMTPTVVGCNTVSDKKGVLSGEVSRKSSEINGTPTTVGQRVTSSDAERAQNGVLSGKVVEKSEQNQQNDSTVGQCMTDGIARGLDNIYINTLTSLPFTSLNSKLIISHPLQNSEPRARAGADSGAMPTKPAPGTVAEFLAQMGLNQNTIYERLLEAGGEALSPTAIGLVQVALPIAWLRQGCDFEADVLPAVRSVAVRAVKTKHRLISSWSYFERAVLEARNNRLAIPKTPDAPTTPQAPPPSAPMAERVAYYLKHNPNGRELLARRGRAAAEAETAKMFELVDQQRKKAP